MRKMTIERRPSREEEVINSNSSGRSKRTVMRAAIMIILPRELTSLKILSLAPSVAAGRSKAQSQAAPPHAAPPV